MFSMVKILVLERTTIGSSIASITTSYSWLDPSTTTTTSTTTITEILDHCEIEALTYQGSKCLNAMIFF